MTNSSFQYTALEYPIELRKNVLSGSKLLIQQLMTYEKIRMIRREKLKKIAEFNTIIADIEQTLLKIWSLLPVTTLVNEEKTEIESNVNKNKQKSRKQKSKTREKKSAKSISKKAIVKSRKIQKKNRIDKLYDNLKQLDEKLSKLQKQSELNNIRS